MKIRLIEPAPPGAHVYSKVHLPRLGLPAIGAALVAQGHEVVIYVADLGPIDWDDIYSADLVGLSSTTSTVVRPTASPTSCAGAASRPSSAARTSPSWPTRPSRRRLRRPG